MNPVDYISLCVNASNMCLSFMGTSAVSNQYWLQLAVRWTRAALLPVGLE